jgi:hypothetical protein
MAGDYELECWRSLDADCAGLGRRPSQAAEVASGGHAPDEHAVVFGVRLHADAIAQHGAAAIRAGRIDRQDADGASGLAQLGGEPVDERALAGPGRPGNADQVRASGLGEDPADEGGGFRSFVFDEGNRAGDGAGVAGADAIGDRAIGHGVSGPAAGAR